MRAAVLGLVFLVGCGASPVTQCYRAAGSYEVAQIVIEGAVYSSLINDDDKETLKKIDRQAVEAAKACRDAAATEDDVLFYTGMLQEATLVAREWSDGNGE